MSVGENIKQLRMQNNMTQSELANAVCVTVSMISQIERDVKTPTILLARDIANVFSCKTDDLLSKN